MSSTKKLIPEISSPVHHYLAGMLSADNLVRIVDDLVADNFLHRIDPQTVPLIERLHEALALYIRDEPTRKQEPGIYIGDDQLRIQAVAFERELEQFESKNHKS